MGDGQASETYTHGHHAAVLRSHEWRTAENSAGYLLAHLRPGQRLLDVGCGPGTITVDLARLVAPGEAVGVDPSADVIERASRLADAPDAPAVSFGVGDVYALDHPDASFDVVHAHQVLQHLTDPVRALVEMKRVLVAGGTLAVRDSDYAAFVWSPADARLERWNELYHQVTARNGAEADAGRHLGAWVRAAGFSEVEVTTSTWTFADPEARAWWGDLWADRVADPGSALHQQALEYGLSDEDELAGLAQAFRQWAGDPDAFFAVLHGEVLAHP